MRVKAKRVKEGFLIPLINGFEDKEEIEVEIELEIKETDTDFLKFLSKIYRGRENISKIPDEKALEEGLRGKYGL